MYSLAISHKPSLSYSQALVFIPNRLFVNWANSFELQQPLVNASHMKRVLALLKNSDALADLEFVEAYWALRVLFNCLVC